MNPTTAQVHAELDDAEVIRRVLAGEVELYELLMRRHNGRLYRAVRSVLRSDPDCEDVMQEAYLQAFRHLDQFRGTARFSTWLIRIGVHAAYARLRKRRVASDLSLQEEEGSMADLHPTPEERTGGHELVGVIEQAIDSLPEAFRTVFVLRSVEDLSTAETAQALDIPEDTVKTRLHRARQLLQRRLLATAEASTFQAFSFHATRCERVVAGVMRRITGAVGQGLP